MALGLPRNVDWQSFASATAAQEGAGSRSASCKRPIRVLLPEVAVGGRRGWRRAGVITSGWSISRRPGTRLHTDIVESHTPVLRPDVVGTGAEAAPVDPLTRGPWLGSSNGDRRTHPTDVTLAVGWECLGLGVDQDRPGEAHSGRTVDVDGRAMAQPVQGPRPHRPCAAARSSSIGWRSHGTSVRAVAVVGDQCADAAAFDPFVKDGLRPTVVDGGGHQLVGGYARRLSTSVEVELLI